MSMPNGPVQVTGTIQFPYTPPPPVPVTPTPMPPVPVPNQCFLCARNNKWTLAITVYKATYLCGDCVRSLPDELIINEFPPTP